MRAIRHLMLLGTVMTLAACVARPTQVTTDWIAPNRTPVPFKKAVTVFLSSDSVLRRRVENRLAQRLPNAVASYTFLPYDRLANPQDVRSELARAGFDGAVVMRLLNVSERSQIDATVSSNPSEDLAEYLRQTPRIALQPGRGETVITMESRVYSVTDGKPLWIGHSQSFNPLSLNDLVDMVVNAATDEIRRQTRVF
jgi:hypothetical protein